MATPLHENKKEQQENLAIEKCKVDKSSIQEKHQ